MSSTWMACRRQLFPFPPSGSSVFPAAGLQPVLIFLLGGQSAADMALRLVDVQYHPGLGRQGGIDVGEAVGDVFMYRTLRYPKLFRRLAHRSILVYDVIGDLDRRSSIYSFMGLPLGTFCTSYETRGAVMTADRRLSYVSAGSLHKNIRRSEAVFQIEPSSGNPLLQNLNN